MSEQDKVRTNTTHPVIAGNMHVLLHCMGGPHRLPPEGLYERGRHKQAQQRADMEAAEHVGGGAGALAGVHQARKHVGGCRGRHALSQAHSCPAQEQPCRQIHTLA